MSGLCQLRHPAAEHVQLCPQRPLLCCQDLLSIAAAMGWGLGTTVLSDIARSYCLLQPGPTVQLWPAAIHYGQGLPWLATSSWLLGSGPARPPSIVARA